MNKIKVLIIDDSALIRKLLTSILSSDPELEVVGVAANPLIAREKIKRLNPDILTLDVEMPEMDGITFLKNLMRLRPTPVVMISTLTAKGATTTLEALSIGAIDFVEKPSVDVDNSMNQLSQDIISKVKTAAQSKVRNAGVQKETPIKHYDRWLGYTPNSSLIIAIGSSTGGPQAVEELLHTFPEGGPPIVISQHIPASFSASFAERLDRVLPVNAYEVKDGMPLESSCVYVSPGDYHFKILKKGNKFLARVFQDKKVNGHRPSVEVMMSSIADVHDGKMIAVMLTGMGNDGAVGMQAMHNKGAYTIAQDEASCVVWGMPRAAVELGCVDQLLPLKNIGPHIMEIVAKL